MFIAIQSTYSNIELGLYSEQTRIAYTIIDKTDATAKLIPVLNEMLIKKNLSLKDIDFIVANKGPAPFTTLRVVLATVNGIALATQIPLVGVDALKAYMEFLEENYKNKNILIVFNAFGGDAYFGLKINPFTQPRPAKLNVKPGSETSVESKGEFGCMNFDLLLEKISNIKNLEIFGNGIETFKDKLLSLDSIKNLDSSLRLEATADKRDERRRDQYPSLDIIANAGLAAFQNKETVYKIEPIYLKQAVKS